MLVSSPPCDYKGPEQMFYCERFRECFHEVLNFSKQQKVLAVDMVTPAGIMQQLAMVKGGLLCLSGNYFARVNVHALNKNVNKILQQLMDIVRQKTPTQFFL